MNEQIEWMSFIKNGYEVLFVRNRLFAQYPMQ